MPSPMKFEISHKPGSAEAKRRIETATPTTGEHTPGGGTVHATWLSDDRVRMTVVATRQTIKTDLLVKDAVIHATLVLPALLSMMAGPITGSSGPTP